MAALHTRERMNSMEMISSTLQLLTEELIKIKSIVDF
jgi:hypothetical protein